MKAALAALAAILLTGSGALAAPAVATDWRYADILQLIKQKEASGQPLQSVDELLEAMPAGSKQWFTFIYQSNAAFQDASFQFPRAVVFTPHLVYAFNGHPSQRGYQTLELMELDDAKGKIGLREIEFVKGANGVEVHAPDETPAKCLQCHGVDPRPIWHEYSDWTGVYGSSDDTMNEAEKTNFATFVGSLKADPKSRYNKLTLPDKFLDGVYYADSTYRQRINLALTKTLVRYNAARVFRLAKQSPYYDALKWALPMTSYHSSCGDKRDRPEFNEKLDAILKARGLRTPKDLFEKMMLVLDLPPARFSPQTGKEDYQYEDGSYQLVQVFFDLVLRDLAASDPPFAEKLKVQDAYYHAEWEHFSLYQWIDQSFARESVTDCHYLQDKADKAMQADLPVPAPTPISQTFEGLLKRAEEVRANGAVPIACVYCHTVDKGAAAGPHFAFDDEKELAGALAADHGRLLERMEMRADPKAADGVVMPPPNNPHFNRLTATEYLDFVSYLRGLKARGPAEPKPATAPARTRPAELNKYQ